MSSRLSKFRSERMLCPGRFILVESVWNSNQDHATSSKKGRLDNFVVKRS